MMELDLSLGEPQKPLKFFANSSKEMVHKDPPGLGFCMGLSPSSIDEELIITCKRDDNNDQRKGSSQDPPLLQLHLHPFSPLHKQYPFPLNPHCLTSERRNRSGLTQKLAEEDAATGSSSPNSSMMSSFGMEYFGIYKDGSGKREHDHQEIEIKKEFYSCSRGESDEEDNGVMGRKKLRLTKDQSAFLEESFKDHHTLNPKQKLALAKHLNLRPRQVEVWFQNRRARTKLKQTEVDCDYLKRCCETLTEENRRLQKELQELRTLKSSNPFYMQLPATTLTMCPSCEHVSSTTTSTAAAITTVSPVPATKPRLLPFLQDQCHAQLQANSN